MKSELADQKDIAVWINTYLSAGIEPSANRRLPYGVMVIGKNSNKSTQDFCHHPNVSLTLQSCWQKHSMDFPSNVYCKKYSVTKKNQIIFLPLSDLAVFPGKYSYFTHNNTQSDTHTQIHTETNTHKQSRPHTHMYNTIQTVEIMN